MSFGKSVNDVAAGEENASDKAAGGLSHACNQLMSHIPWEYVEAAFITFA